MSYEEIKEFLKTNPNRRFTISGLSWHLNLTKQAVCTAVNQLIKYDEISEEVIQVNQKGIRNPFMRRYYYETKNT